MAVNIPLIIHAPVVKGRKKLNLEP